MYARVTLVEVDTDLVGMDDAISLYRHEVLPQLQSMPGYRGVLVLSTPAGKAIIETFWESAEAADASGPDGVYPELLEQAMTLFRAPPGRERYSVAFTALAPLGSA